MAKSVKVEKEVFDRLLGKMLNTPTVPREKLKGKKKVSQILKPIEPNC